eukprot:6190450-Pleurochrysis_carterae.AAC.3
MPTHALGSMRVFEYASRGFTAKARQPEGRMGMIRGFNTPVKHSQEDIGLCGGPVVRFSTSTECATA